MFDSDSYYDDESISQSKIKKFIESKTEYKSIYIDKYKSSKDTDNLKFGRFHHDYFYQYNTLSSKYIVMLDSDIIGSMMGEFIVKVSEGITKEEAHILCGFKQSYETTLKAFNKLENQKYYNLLLQAQGKTIVSDIDRNIAKKMKAVYTAENEYLKTAIKDGWKIFPEQEVFFTSNFSSLDLKMKADQIYISPDFSKVVIEDSKGTEDLNLKEFINTIKRYRYDIQQSFYKLGVQHWIEEKFNVIVPYDQIEFVFIPQRKQYPYEILDFIEIDGVSEQKAYNDWTSALIDLEYCLTTNDWNKDKSSYEGNRKIVKVW